MANLSAVENVKHRSDLTMGIGAHAYTSSDVFVHEQNAIFARTWQYVCHLEKVRQAGDYFVVEVAGESVILIRGEDGDLRAFYNVCSHRGARLLSGQGCRSRVSCPYHGWTYDDQGHLIGAPNAQNVPGFDRSAHGLKPVRVEDLHGLIFVNLDPDATPLRQVLPGLEEQLKSFSPDLPDLTFAHRTQADLATNWKVAVENYSECYHCSLVHKDFFGADGVDASSYRIQLKGDWHLHLADSRTQEDGRDHVNEFAAWWLWPNFAIQSHPGCVLNVRRWTPVSAGETHVFVDWFFENADLSPEDQAMVDHHAATVFAEDIPLVESVQAGMTSRAYDNGPLMVDAGGTELSEHAVADIQRLWRRDMGVA